MYSCALVTTGVFVGASPKSAGDVNDDLGMNPSMNGDSFANYFNGSLVARDCSVMVCEGVAFRWTLGYPPFVLLGC